MSNPNPSVSARFLLAFLAVTISWCVIGVPVWVAKELWGATGLIGLVLAGLLGVLVFIRATQQQQA